MRKRVRCFALMLAIFMGGYLFTNITMSAEAGYVNNNWGSSISTDSSSWKKGLIVVEGARLRAEPNTNCTIYGLMYPFEEVQVNEEMSTMTFYYVKRVSTGEYGYVSRDFVFVDSGITASVD